MNKCNIDDQSLKLIKNMAARVFRSSLKDHWSASMLKANVKNLFNEITDKYDVLNNIVDIALLLNSTAIKYGVTSQIPDYLSTENIINNITANIKNILINDSIETSDNRIFNPEQIRRRSDANSDFLDNAYGLAKEVLEFATRTTNRNLFDCLFINRGSILNAKIGIVRNNSELNQNIRIYQEYLLSKICKYVWSIVRQAPNLHIDNNVREALKNPQLYNENNQYTGVLELIKPLLDNYLDIIDSDTLRLLYNTMNSNTSDNDSKILARNRLEAYNARVILDNFDTYLVLLLGKSILIKDFNIKTGENKYQIAAQTAKVTTTWRTNENINVEEEADSITRLAINTTPLLRWGSNSQIGEKFLYFSDFQHIIAKIKDLAFNSNTSNVIFNDDFIFNNQDLWDSLSKKTLDILYNKSLKSVIATIRENPRKYLSSVFEILTNSDFKDLYNNTIYDNFTSDELNKLWSLSYGIFNGSNSLYNLTTGDFDTDYYSFIAETADSIFNVKYILYYRDKDGLVLTRTLTDLSVNNVQRSIEQTINASNSKKLIKSWDDYKNELNINPLYDNNHKLSSIYFTVPNTNITVQVFASSGDVSVTINNVPVNYGGIYEQVLPFIDTILRLGIENDSDFSNALFEQFGDKANLSRSLLLFASRVIFNQFVSNEIISDLSTIDKDRAIKSIYGRNAPSYNYALDELNLVHGNDIPTLKNIAIAKSNYQGVTTSTIVRDGEGNGQSLLTQSRLLGAVQSLFELQEKSINSASRHFILLQNPEILKEIYTTKEFYDPNGNSKLITAMTPSELTYYEIVYDFVGGLIEREGKYPFGNGIVAFLPSVNSDKGTIGKIVINLNAEITFENPLGDEITKRVRDLSIPELKVLISNELGKFYENMFNLITDDWRTLENYISQTIPDVKSLGNDFTNRFVNFNEWFFINQVRLSLYGDNPVNFIKYFVRKYNEQHRLNPISIVDQVHYKSNKGSLATNDVILALIARFKPDSIILANNPELLVDFPSEENFWNAKNRELLKTMLKEGFRINTSNTLLSELRYIRDNYREWINSSGDVILAKVRGINITSTNDLIKYGIDLDSELNQLNVKLNPLFEWYNTLEYLFTLEFMNSTVGSFVAHPLKSGSNDVLVQEAAQFNAQHKRNVSFTAAMHPFLLNLLKGIPKDYNIAVIEDIKDEQGTINGTVSSIKPFDGAVFVNPFIVILENNSLGGARAGITKKLFVHFKEEQLGVAGIIKCAGFGLTNDTIRNSKFMQTMMRKMTNHVWLRQDGSPSIVDITTNYKGNKIVYNDIYFKRGNKYYKLNNITSLGNNEYDVAIQEVSIGGNTIGNEFSEKHSINTNYALWNLFGGLNSMEIVNGKLQFSNTSIENVVIAMNSIGDVINENVETLDDLWQPLKHTDVHYVVTAGAIKQGGANMNSAKRYFDNIDYDIQKISMYQSGIQLDKEHHADESDISLMTLVISACASRGFSVDVAMDLYNTLRQATEVNTKDHFEAVKELFTDGSELSINKLLEVMVKSIIKAFGNKTSNSNNFAEIIARDLIKKAREGLEIKYSKVLMPLSDNTIHAKVLSTITSYLTKTGIRLKVSGLLAVLTPSHSIYKLYGDRKLESFTNPEIELEELQRQQVPIYDSGFLYNPSMLEFMGMQIERVPYNSLVSTVGEQPVAVQNPYDGRVLIDTELLRLKFNEKAWKNLRNSKPLDRDFKSYEEWEHFVLMHEAMRNIYSLLENESDFDYETRINDMALKRLDNNISNLELGRTYYVTSLVPVNEELEDGSTNLTFEAVTNSVLIRTAQEYKNLKKQILDGTVISVVENVKEGRDLAGYNVRFSTTDGSNFQLWDLDSALDLFELTELRDNWKNIPENIQRLYELYSNYSDTVPEITLNNVPEIINQLERLIRRVLLSDLFNLSPMHLDRVLQLRDFINTYENTPLWFDKFASAVNILLGRSDGNTIVLNGERITVNSNNYANVLGQVITLLDRTNKVKIDGTYYSVNRNSISRLAYEVILPKIFATVFGLEEFDDLHTIMNDKDFFIKLYLLNRPTKVLPNQYSIEFKRSNGNHIYLLNTRFLPSSNLLKLNNIIHRTDEDGRMFRLDSSGDDMYEITSDTTIYTDNLGNEVIVSDDIDFYINNLSYDTIKISDNLVTRPSLLTLIVSSLKKSSNTTAKKFGKHLTKNGRKPSDIINANNKFHSINLDNYKTFPEDNYIIRMGRAKHTSFLKALDVVAARIPAQSMQSYMPMRVVAFDNPDINNAYVSTYQILLLGSDYDIDAGNFATFSIDKNGLLQLWSPYADITSVDKLLASKTLPIPTGRNVKLIESNNLNDVLDIFDKYGYLFNFDESEDDVNVELNLHGASDIESLGLLLKEYLNLIIPDQSIIRLFISEFNRITEFSRISGFNLETEEQVQRMFEKLGDIINLHNSYYDNVGSDKLNHIINNLIMEGMYDSIIDPVNLIQALTSVDGTTGPLKDVGNRSLENEEIKTRTSGNFLNKNQSINDNQVGKLCIGICAVGLKTFFALTLYYNYVLNNGTSEQLKRLLFNKLISGKRYNLLANVRTNNINSIISDDVLIALAKVDNDYDAAIILSALLSLSTDNAKELLLSKLNATAGTISMYTYGLSIGMKFEDIAKLLMSDVGKMLASLTKSNVFLQTESYSSIDQVFGYFDKIPNKFLSKFDITRDLDKNSLDISPLNFFKQSFLELENWIKDKDGKLLPFNQAIAIFAKSNVTLLSKLQSLEKLRKAYKSNSVYGNEVYNLLIDFIEEYTKNLDLASKNEGIMNDLQTLANGAAEFRILGLILSLNQGIKTDLSGFIRQINNIERIIYNKTEDKSDIIDLKRFAFDRQYREAMILKYEEVKDTVNVLDVISTVPHYLGYVQTLATALTEEELSFKFRTIRALSLLLTNDINYKDENKIINGISKYVGDYLRKTWMRHNDIQVIIPKGNKAFDNNGNLYDLTQDTPFKLGTDWGDATFRMFVENTIIPDLKVGKIKQDTLFDPISDNKFIRDLNNDIITNTVSKNPTVVYTLPINMLPRTNPERALLNSYKSEFNKLSKYSYEYVVSNYDNNGNVLNYSIVSIPLLDIFTYYGMIADSWRLNEKSLVPILEDFLTSGQILNFHDFEAAIDKSDISLKNIDLDEIIPYVAPYDSPYKSYSTHIWYRNPLTKKVLLMRKLSRLDYENYNEYDGYENQNTIGSYEFQISDVDTNYFQTGRIDSPTKMINYNLLDGDQQHAVWIEYDIDSGQLMNVAVDSNKLDLGISKIPTIKQNGIKKVDKDLLDCLIKNKMNPC